MTVPGRWWTVAALLLSTSTATPSRTLETYSLPRFASAFDRATRELVDRIDAYSVAPPLYRFLVDSIDANLKSDSSGWVRTWGQRGWAPPLSVLFRLESGRVVDHRIDSQVTAANDSTLATIARKIDSCGKWLESIRKAEADSLAEANASFQGLVIGSSRRDSLDGLGAPMETRILEKGRVGVVVDSDQAPLHVTLFETTGKRVNARRIGYRLIAEEYCPGYNGLPGDSMKFSVAVYVPETPVQEILVALRGTPSISRFRVLHDSVSRTRFGLRGTLQGRFEFTPWQDIWYRDTMVAKLQGDDDFGLHFENTYQFTYRGRTIHGYSAIIPNGFIFGWLFRTESGWRDVNRSEALASCID